MASMQLERRAAESVAAENNVIFDQIVSSEGDISYNGTTGVITINQTGQFIISWWVATQTSSSLVGAVFSIRTSQNDQVIGASPIKTGSVSGSCTIDVEVVPVTVSLVNENTHVFFYSPIVPVKAALMITSGPQGETGPTGPQGEIGPTGPQGAIFPFSISQGSSGVYISTDEEGNPLNAVLAGFGSTYPSDLYFQPGQWASGTFTLGDSSAPFGTAFVMPTDGVLKRLYVTFGNKSGFSVDEGVSMYPFACLAVSDGSNLDFTILQDTITETAPYVVSSEPFPLASLRSGSSTALNVPLQAGSLVTIVLGWRGEGVTQQQYNNFAMSGGMYIE